MEKHFFTSQLANADQLFGFAVECGLKKLMMQFGMTVKDDGSPTKDNDRVHANKIWARVLKVYALRQGIDVALENTAVSQRSPHPIC